MNILVCEVEDIMMTAIKFRLEKHGFNMVAVTDGEAALESIKQGDVEFAIIGTELSKKSAEEIIETTRKKLKSNLPFIVVADQKEGDTVLDFLDAGANDFVIRPFKPMELVLRIKQIVKTQS